MAATFYERFSYFMNCAGCPAPTELFGTYTTAVSSLAALVAASKTLGAGATVADLFAAAQLGMVAEVLVVAAGIGAAYYVGVAAGALLMATLSWGDTSHDYNSCSPADLFALMSTPSGMDRAAEAIGTPLPRFVQDVMSTSMPQTQTAIAQSSFRPAPQSAVYG